MFERVMTFRRPVSSQDEPAGRPPGGEGARPQEDLTRAQARAQSRCQPLTPAEFKARRRLADQGLTSLADLLDQGADSRRR